MTTGGVGVGWVVSAFKNIFVWTVGRFPVSLEAPYALSLIPQFRLTYDISTFTIARKRASANKNDFNHCIKSQSQTTSVIRLPSIFCDYKNSTGQVGK